jgi:hypothetical protein
VLGAQRSVPSGWRASLRGSIPTCKSSTYASCTSSCTHASGDNTRTTPIARLPYPVLTTLITCVPIAPYYVPFSACVPNRASPSAPPEEDTRGRGRAVIEREVRHCAADGVSERECRRAMTECYRTNRTHTIEHDQLSTQRSRTRGGEARSGIGNWG